MNKLMMWFLFLVLWPGISLYAVPDTEPPEVTITSPQDGEFFIVSEITVSGTVTDEDTVLYVRVNGVDAALDGDNFSCTLTLFEGENVLTVESEDNFGNVSTKQVEVVKDSTAPDIEVLSPLKDSFVDSETITLSGTFTDSYPFSITMTPSGGSSLQGEIIGNNFYFKDFYNL